MLAIHRIHQLGSHPQLLTRFLYTALQHITHTQLLSHFLYLGRLAFVGETRIAGNHKQTGVCCQHRDEVFRQAISKVILFRIPSEVVER